MCVICINSDWLDVTSLMYVKQCSYKAIISTFIVSHHCPHQFEGLHQNRLFNKKSHTFKIICRNVKHYSDSEMHLKIILPYINTLCIGSQHKKQSIITSRLPLFFLNIRTGNKQYTNDGLMIYTGIICPILVDKSHFEWLIQDLPYKNFKVFDNQESNIRNKAYIAKDKFVVC